MENVQETQQMKLVDSVFTKEPSQTVSPKYVHIPTDRIVGDMELLGWKVDESKEVKTRKASKKGYQKHIIKFSNPNIVIKDEDGDNAHPQIILINSHDGSTAFQFRVGIYRLVCSNGLVIATSEFSRISVRHMGYTFEDLQEIINGVMVKLPTVMSQIQTFKDCHLSDEEMKEFALKACTARFGDKYDVDILEVLQAKRVEDEGNSLWAVFNRVQEKLITGGFNSINNKTKKHRSVSAIKSFVKDIKLNEEIWKLAEQYTCK